MYFLSKFQHFIPKPDGLGSIFEFFLFWFLKIFADAFSNKIIEFQKSEYADSKKAF
jgi:hypothetical protein